MRLYLEATAKSGLGYTPNWIRCEYVNPETKQKEELTMDILGEIEYSPNNLNVRVKGELTPWSFCNLETGEEKDLDGIDNSDEYLLLFNQIFSSSKNITIGLYPVDEENGFFTENDSDEFSNCQGSYDFVDGESIRSIDFTFDCEICY